jgi:hypothetical protein
MRAEWHISSLVIHAFPTALMLVLAELDAIDGLEVHAATGDGRVVATHGDRDGNMLAALSPRRYACLSCHVPQTDAREPIENTFVDMDDIIAQRRPAAVGPGTGAR